MPTVQEAPPSARRLWMTWSGWVTAGASLGFAVPALTVAFTARLHPALMAASLLIAGAVQGYVLGAAQARVLRRCLPSLSRHRWIAATTAGASVSWLIGLLPLFTFGNVGSWPLFAVGVLAVLLAVALLLPIGAAQWTVLRPHVALASRWIITNATGWLGGFAAFAIAAALLWHPGQSLAVRTGLGLLAGLVMAATFAVITAMGLLRLLFLVPPGLPGRY